jgi:hypothetical protein
MGRNYQDSAGANNPNYRNGFSVRGNKQNFYNSWQNMKGRCLRESHPKYPRYGGRGVKICDEWMTIEGFAKWALSNGWVDGLSLDRIDNNGDYCPENCRWITMSENSRKKRTTKLTFDQAQEIRKRLDNGENEHALADEYGVVHGTIWFIKKKMTHVPEGDCTKMLKLRQEAKQERKAKQL